MLFFGIFGLTFSDLILRWNLINFQLESLSVFFASSGNVFAEGILVFRTKGNFYIKNKGAFHWTQTSSSQFRKFLSDKWNAISGIVGEEENLTS